VKVSAVSQGSGESQAAPRRRVERWDGDFLTVDEAAAFLRCNRKTVYEAVARNALPGVVRLGRVIRIHRTALLEWPTEEAAVPRGADR